MKFNLDRKLMSKIFIALIICALAVTIILANGANIKDLLYRVEGGDDLISDGENIKDDGGTNDTISYDPLYLASQLGDNGGISSGTDTSDAGYSWEFSDVSSGKFHILVADKDGFVYSRGSNSNLQLGLASGSSITTTDTSRYYNYFQPVVALNDTFITKVSAGGYHSIAMGHTVGQPMSRDTFKVFTWGRQSSGRLGNGVSTDTNTGIPQDITSRFSFASGEYPVDVSAGEHHSMLLTNHGNVYTWGSNWYGQLGLGRATGSASGDVSTPQKVTSLSNVKQISAGSVHSLALNTSGHLYTFGGNTHFQLGVDTDKNTKRATPTRAFASNTFDSVSAGELHNGAISGTTMYLWGDRRGGKLGNGNPGNYVTDTNSASATLVSYTGYKAVSAGGGNTMAIRTDNYLYVTGYGTNLYYNKTDNGSLQSTGLMVDHIDAGGMNLFVFMSGTQRIMMAYGYAAHPSEHRFEGEHPISGGYWDTSPVNPSLNVTYGSADTQKRLTPLNNILGIPTGYNRTTASNNIAPTNNVTFNVSRIKITGFAANHASIQIAQVTKEQYDANLYDSVDYHSVGSKGAIVNREGYYFLRYVRNGTQVTQKFVLFNNSGPEITLNNGSNTYFASISLYDAFGLSEVTVNGRAINYNGSTENYSTSQQFSTTYNTTYDITKNSDGGMFTVTAKDRDGKSTTVKFKVDTVVEIINQGYTVNYDGNKHTVEPMFYTPARGEFNKSFFNANYSGYTVSSVYYAGGTGFDAGNNAPINASDNNYSAYFDVRQGGTLLDSTTVNIKINKTTPALTTVTDEIFYGQSLSSANLRGTAVNPYNTSLSLANGNLLGSFSWPSNIPGTNPSVSYSGDYAVVFTPDDTINYNIIPITTSLKINKTTPTLSEIWADEITYESSLASSKIGGTVTNSYNGSSIAGIWTWDTGSIDTAIKNHERPEVSESGIYPVIFVPSNTTDYNWAYDEAGLVVNKQTQLLTFNALDSNPYVAKETMASDLADFEVSYSDKTITLTAYTTAIYPELRPINFSLNNLTLASLQGAETDSYILGGTTYSRTVITLKINDNNNFGVVTITAGQYDSNNDPSNDNYQTHAGGNYENSNTQSYRLFIKQEHFANDFDSFDLVYGRDSFELTPNLNSGLVDYKLDSNLKGVLTVSQDLTKARTLEIQNVGTVTLTISHPGYVNRDNFALSYMAFTKSINVTINPTPLNIRVEDITIEYGSTPTFTYVYDGLVYGEDPSVVLTGLINSYYSTPMVDVIREGEGYGSYTIDLSGTRNTLSAYPNYDISHTSGSLTITPKKVVASVLDASKLYGAINPPITVTYDGFLDGENENNSGTAPKVNYGEVEQFSNVGTYTITLTGGFANNYEYDISSTGTLTVNPRAVDGILINAPTDMEYSGFSAEVSSTIWGLEEEGYPDAAPPARKNDPDAITYSFLIMGGTEWVNEIPDNVGVYSIRATYNPAANDNYDFTTWEFEYRLVILATNPVLHLESMETQYTSYSIEANGVALAIENGSLPEGNLTYRYSINESSYSLIPPRDAGVYSVMITYTPTEGDNYKAFSATFEDALTILKVNALLSLETEERVYASDDEMTPNRVRAKVAQAKGIGEDDNLPQDNRFVYEYFIEDEWKNDTNLPTNVGSYAVRVTYKALENENYLTTTTVFEARVIILPADISDYINLARFEVDYTGNMVELNHAIVNGIPGGSQPLGNITYQYQLGSSDYSSIPMRNANTYNVKVIYTSVQGDNYASTSKNFQGALVINKVTPIISLSSFRFEFNGINRSITGTVTGIPGGSVPMGRLVYTYIINGTRSATGPKDAGAYAVEVSYIESPEDNYKSYTPSAYVDAIIITPARPDIFLDTKRADYTGENIGANDASIRGKAQDTEGPAGATTYQYYINNTWTDEQPTNSGSYNVKVIFTAVEGTNYISVEKICTNALIIRNIAPEIALETRIAPYNGGQVVANPAVVVSEYGEAQGTWSYEYNVGGNSWTSRAPINAGTYHVMVRYNEADVDNYSTKTQIFENALVINPIDIVVTPESNQGKIYDGKRAGGDGGDTIAFNRVSLITGNQWSGALSAGNNSDAGSYPITKGTLSAGGNYNIIFTEGIMYTIEKREIALIFPVVNNVFDNMHKQPIIEVDNSKLIEGDFVQVNTRYVGDTLNVGTFIAVAEDISNNNYKLPPHNSMEYAITPARMSGNSFISYTTSYNKSPHKIVLSSQADGAKVVYDSPTEYISRGVYTVTATITKPNYFPETLTATLTITKGVFNVIPEHPREELYYGDPLPKLNSNQNDGGITYLDEGQKLIPGEHQYSWTFEPFDTENYEMASGTMTLKVRKSETIVYVQGSLTQYSNNPQKLQVNVIGGSGSSLENAEIYYLDTSGEVYSSLPLSPGRYTMNVKFLGDEFHEPATYTTVVVIKEKSNLSWVAIAVGAVVVLVSASAIYFIHRGRKMSSGE